MSFNITGRFVKVWATEDKGTFVKCDLGTSRKNKDGKYDNSSWKGCRFVGKCVEEAQTLAKGDTIEITSGLLGKREYQGKWYDDVTIFSFEVTTKSTPVFDPPGGQPSTDEWAEDDSDTSDIPF